MKHFIISYADLNEMLGFNISDDSFFSEGSSIVIDGQGWELVEVVGCMLVFTDHDDFETAQDDMDFFYERSIS